MLQKLQDLEWKYNLITDTKMILQAFNISLRQLKRLIIELQISIYSGDVYKAY